MELKKQLSLAGPSCKKSLAVLAALTAAEVAEGGGDVSQYVALEKESLKQQALRWSTYLMIVLITVGAVRFYNHVTRLVAPLATRSTKSVGSQTQTTYTEVRGVARPRFRVLPEHAHG